MIKPEQPKIPDGQKLWDKMLDGDDQALASLFSLYYPMLYNYGMKISYQQDLVKDSIQDIFAYIWEKRRSISQVNSVSAYLLAAVRRKLVKSIESERKRQYATQELEKESSQIVSSTEDLIIETGENAEQEAKLNNALQKLPSRMHEALYLKKYEALSYKEISKIMKVSPQVARNYVFEAVQRLRLLLGTTTI